MTENPIIWALLFILLGSGLVLAAKIYGLIFMRGKTPHRLGDVMSVNRAEVVEWSNNEGMVSAGGELWKARSKDPLQPGDNVDIETLTGLILTVRKKEN